MATSRDERNQQEAQVDGCLEEAHFCTCAKHDCPVNPHNPKNRGRGLGCDGCIKMNLALGKIPSCFFRKVGEIGDWEDFSIAGFVSFCQERA